jgi:Leucine-rich repeat (LRR) protein
MSHRNDHLRNSELVVANETIESSDDVTRSDTIIHELQPTLPTGEVIDGKNTLRSFDTIEPTIQRLSTNVCPTETSKETRSIVAEAIKEVPNIVYAELAPELEPSFNIAAIDNCNKNNVPPVSWYKNRFTYVMLVVFVTVVATGLGIYFGLRNDDSLESFPVNSPTSSATIVPVNAPNSSPAASPVNVASSSPTKSPVNNPNSSPVNAPVDGAAALAYFINSITLSNRTIAANGTSPESMALKWMITNDTTLDATTLTNLDSALPSRVGRSIRQRFALLVLWFQQRETDKWARTDGWLEDPNECNWYGISCDSMFFEGSGDNQTVVTQIALNGTGSYVGVIPSDVGLLSFLQHFEIRNTTYDNDRSANFLQGTLPDSIGRWTALTLFDVSGNALNGTLPDSISQWTALTYFDVYNNSFIGTIPDIIDSWSALTYLDISVNAIIGTLPDSIGNWTSLSHFVVRYNELTGTLPESIGRWTALTYFSVRFNELTGTLPDTISQWTALTYFGAFNNSFIGTLPDSVGLWTALTNFDVGYNELTGKLPESIGQWTELIYFDVRFNRLNGTLPDIIGQWTSLSYFVVRFNGLTGALPDSISQWTALTYFGVFNNSFIGTLPESIGQWTALTYFDVGYNELTGRLPESIGQLTALTWFNVFNNNLVGTIPRSIGNWSAIENASFGSNQFIGTLPNVICQYIEQDVDCLQADDVVNCPCCTTCNMN